MRQRPLTKRMHESIDAMARLENDGKDVVSPNEIAYEIGFTAGQDGDKSARDGRRMAPAQRVIFPLISLRRRGLVAMRSRRDGMSGVGYSLTERGWRATTVERKEQGQ